MNNSFRYLLIMLLFISFLFSCENTSNGEKTTNESEVEDTNKRLKEEVIAIHDEVMPLMGALKKEQKRLSEEASDLQAQDADLYEEEIAHRQNVADELEEAYDGMFVWMRQFRPQELDNMDDDEGKAYLLEQKVEVEKVNENIKSSLKRAKEIEPMNK